jgi:hypothetical protein
LGNGIWAAGDARKRIVLDFLWNFLREFVQTISEHGINPTKKTTPNHI